MLSRSLKKSIEKSFNEIQINLENNYKDLAILAKNETEKLLNSLHDSGKLAGKYYQKYSKQLLDYIKKWKVIIIRNSRKKHQ